MSRHALRCDLGVGGGLCAQPNSTLRNSSLPARKACTQHDGSKLHELSLEVKEGKQQQAIKASASAMEQLEKEAMANLMRVAMHISKHKKAFLEYENLLFLSDLQARGAEIGQREHSRITAATMIDVTTQVGVQCIKNFLNTTNPLMNHKPHVTWKADKVSDVKGKQFEIVNVYVNFQGSPLQSQTSIPACQCQGFCPS